MATMINVENLNLTFGAGDAAHQVLDGINMHVKDGEVFGLIGESGCGKSTILRCMAGLYTDWRGHLSIDGHTLGRQIDKARCRLMQMVFQDPYGSLHPRQTVGTALAEPLKVQRMGDINDRIDAMLVKVGLPKAVRTRYPHQLSGGQRQRVAIARALILEPRVLLLDEPTSALDVSVQAEVLNLLSDLQQASGLTYVVVTHDLGVLVHLCDRFAVMREGKIVETLHRGDLESMEDRHPYTRMLVEASSHV